tara:strand:- start:680 stop:931 length:252 start_codon:yes stop_codon:yes gene_type:complete
MAIKLNDKWYDETQFTPEVKQAILQVTSYQKQINNLMQDVQNAKIIVAHHAKYIQENVPSSAEIEEPKAEEAVEEPVSTETKE